MDIGTAKPTPGERSRVAHHLIDVADPAQDWDVASFMNHAARAVSSIESRGHRALFVGGTGLYLHALVDNFCVPGRWRDIELVLDQEPDVAALYRRLAEVDPAAAARIEPGNRRRVVRALEVTLGSGRPFSSYGPGVSAFPPTTWQIAGVWLPRQVAAARIEARFREMVTEGLVDEVKALSERPEGLSRTARQALGYRELLGHVEKGVPLEEACAQAVRRTVQFGRRQRMWWRRDPRVRWFGAPENSLDILPALLGNWDHDQS